MGRTLVACELVSISISGGTGSQEGSSRQAPARSRARLPPEAGGYPPSGMSLETRAPEKKTASTMTRISTGSSMYGEWNPAADIPRTGKPRRSSGPSAGGAVFPTGDGPTAPELQNSGERMT